MITSHQGFYTKEALSAIAQTTLQNLKDAEAGIRNENDVA
jgi:D-lactate dehydrogenase